MPSGGSRNRSGPAPDPKSGRSDARGLRFDQLPSAGYEGEAPDYPLPALRRYEWVTEDGSKFRQFDEDASEAFRDRELHVWEDAWSTPQAAVWAVQAWRWQIVAEYCRVKTSVELEPDASAALIGQLHRFRDQIGLTPAGMRENGWQVAVDEVGAHRATRSAEVTAPAPARRLRAVDGA